MTTPEPDYALVSAVDLKAELNIAETEIAWDARLRRLVRFVTSGIETYCGRRFLARTETLTLNGDGSDCIFVDPPILGTVTLTIDGLAVAVDDMVVDYETGRIRLLGGLEFTPDQSNVTVALRHGYERADLPAQIEMAAILWAAEIYKVLTESRVGVSSVSRGDETISYANTTIPDRVAGLVAPFRIVRW
jgi:hypothetical protein